MSSLAKLGRKIALQQKLERIQQSEVSTTAECDLLEISFSEWCQSLRIKTPDGLAPFKMFDWRLCAELEKY